MEKNLLVVVLFMVLSTQEIAAVITRTCKSRSREFGGRCLRGTQRNCNIVCMHEEFQYGVCRLGRCYCVKPCGSPSGKTPPKKPPQKPPPHGGTPPAHGGTPPDQGEETPPDHQGGGETPPDSEGPPDEEFAQFLLEETQAN